MKLKYNKYIIRKVIVIELETTNFSSTEDKLFEEYGEPVINFEKVYYSNHPIQIANKKIKSGFKLKIKFDGTQDMVTAADAANEFFQEIKELLEIEMSDLSYKATDANFKSETGYEDIVY